MAEDCSGGCWYLAEGVQGQAVVGVNHAIHMCHCCGHRGHSVQQEAHLSPSDRAMRLVSSNLVNYHATVQKLLIRQVLTRIRLEPERTGTPFLFFFWSPERRSGPFRHIAARFRFHLNESDKFAYFGSKMPSASGGLRPLITWPGNLCPWTPLGAPPPDSHIGSRSRARYIFGVPVLFLTGNEPWSWPNRWYKVGGLVGGNVS